MPRASVLPLPWPRSRLARGLLTPYHSPPLSLSQTRRRQNVIELHHCTRRDFRIRRLMQVYATLLDEGQYHCSMQDHVSNPQIRAWRMSKSDVRGHQRTQYQKAGTFGNGSRIEVWSWDITKLKGPAKWTYFYLYVILDIFSRYVVGLDGGPLPSNKALATQAY